MNQNNLATPGNAQTFQQHQQHIYANAANLKQSRLDMQHANGPQKDDNHVYSNLTLAMLQHRQSSNFSQAHLSSQSSNDSIYKMKTSHIINQLTKLPTNVSSDSLLTGLYGNIGKEVVPSDDNMMTCTNNEKSLANLPFPPRPARVNDCIVPANPYLNEEIPHWLFIYSKAPSEHDHKLKVSFKDVISNALIVSVLHFHSGNCFGWLSWIVFKPC